MSMTLTEKLISAHLVSGEMKRGERIGIKIDQTLTHDVNGVMTYLEFEAMGLKSVKNELAVSYIDHNLIQADFKNPDDHNFLIDIGRKYGVVVSRPGNGICHQVHLERFAVPGKSLLGTDSHTTAGGGIGTLAIGAGGLDVAVAMAGEPFYFKMPQVVNVYLTGKLRPFVSAKNVILELLRRISVKGGVSKVFEYTGPGVKTLNVTERSIIANMGTETGATTSIFPSDEITKQWMRAQGRENQWVALEADDNARYDETVNIDLSTVDLLIALPHQPDKVVPVSEVEGLPVDQVVFGSCSNSSVQDILSVANILKNKTVHKNVTVGLYPGSRQTYLESLNRGAIAQLVKSGVRILESACGACNGSGFAPPTNGVSLRTTTRNFTGRSGTASGNVYLVGPEVAAASAIAGVIADTRKLGIEPSVFVMPEKFIIDDNMFINMQKETAAIQIRRGPNITPLPYLEALPDVISGEALIKLGDDITTDHIVPAGANFLPIRANTPELAKHVFHVVDITFFSRAAEAGGGFIVAGINYGQGSSREQAALSPRFLGVKAIVTKSFARIHLANLVNFGILPLVFENEKDYDGIKQGDQLSISINHLKAKEKLVIKNKTQGKDIVVTSPLSQEELDIVKKGGRLNWIKERSKNK